MPERPCQDVSWLGLLEMMEPIQGAKGSDEVRRVYDSFLATTVLNMTTDR